MRHTRCHLTRYFNNSIAIVSGPDALQLETFIIACSPWLSEEAGTVGKCPQAPRRRAQKRVNNKNNKEIKFPCLIISKNTRTFFACQTLSDVSDVLPGMVKLKQMTFHVSFNKRGSFLLVRLFEELRAQYTYFAPGATNPRYTTASSITSFCGSGSLLTSLSSSMLVSF